MGFFYNECGISKVGDLVSKSNNFPGSKNYSQFKTNSKSISPLSGSGQRHTLMNGVPPSRKKSVEQYLLIENSFQVPINGKVFDLLSISSIVLYRELRPLRLNSKMSTLTSMLTRKKSNIPRAESEIETRNSMVPWPAFTQF